MHLEDSLCSKKYIKFSIHSLLKLVHREQNDYIVGKKHFMQFVVTKLIFIDITKYKNKKKY